MTDTTRARPDSSPSTSHPVERRPRRRWARGVDRPQYLRAEDIDRLGIMMVALMSEVSALRDRLDTHEAVAELGSPVTREAIEAYELTPERRERREVERQALLKRVLRVITEDREAALESAPGDAA
ncbi:hypothetical protein [Brevundimonas sp.]|uniref:hypothetical protein n=1 Tax=Brevundimonas sp. TaxID=1871086 RepID=UPI003D09DD23